MNFVAGVGGLSRALVLGVIVFVAFVGLFSMMKQKNARLWKWMLIIFIGGCFFLMLYKHVLRDYFD